MAVRGSCYGDRCRSRLVCLIVEGQDVSAHGGGDEGCVARGGGFGDGRIVVVYVVEYVGQVYGGVVGILGGAQVGARVGYHWGVVHASYGYAHHDGVVLVAI